MRVNEMRGTHGLSRTKTHTSWLKMKTRCNNPNATQYKWYGGRGITVCEKWNTFLGFLEDMGQRPEGTTLDRINNDLGYSKENCRWASRKEQANNQRSNIKVEGVGVPDLSRGLKIKAATLRKRKRSGWNDRSILETPLRGSWVEWEGIYATKADWARILKIPRLIVSGRLSRGWSIDDLISGKLSRNEKLKIVRRSNSRQNI